MYGYIITLAKPLLIYLFLFFLLPSPLSATATLRDFLEANHGPQLYVTQSAYYVDCTCTCTFKHSLLGQQAEQLS